MLYYKDLSKFEKDNLKVELIKNGKYELYRKYYLAQYFKCLSDTQPSEHVLKMLDELSCYLCLDFSNYSIVELKLCAQIYQSHTKKIYRLKNKIKTMLKKGPCLFLTLTFRDDVLENTSADTRRKYVRRLLKSSLSSEYIANIDFGQDENFTQREHYHCILRLEHFNLDSWRYGFSYVESVRSNEVSATCLSKYINKLTNHAYKTSTKWLNRLIYSRKVF